MTTRYGRHDEVASSAGGNTVGQPTAKVALRWRDILEQVRSGNGHVGELSARLGVSEATIRRDLRQMSASGWLARTYGGAVHMDSLVEHNLSEKEKWLRQEKHYIADLASTLVCDGETVILDAGSTVGALASRLRDRSHLTVLTNGINSVITLRDVRDIELFVLGGQLRTKSQATLGSMAEEGLRRFFADKAFLGAYGVHPELGISSPTAEQCYLKSLMMQRAREIYVLADHSKLGSMAFPHWAQLDRPYTLITDMQADTADALARFRDDPHCTVLVAGPVSSRASDHGNATAEEVR